MVPLSSCCTAAATATAASAIPYRRLRNLRCSSSAAKQRQGEEQDKDEQAKDGSGVVSQMQPVSRVHSMKESSSETVVLKIAIVGDCESGKTCFMRKYVGSEQNLSHESGIMIQEKSSRMKTARIVFSIWELPGNKDSEDLLPKVCDNAAAFLVMFDLTRRSTLNSVKYWFIRARRWNKVAIPVLVGTKYDEFINLPHDIQLALTKQAMFYAKRMQAPLFFSSTTHNINVHKIFKVIVAKVFDLQCSISKNYNIGEPIVDY